MLSETLKHVILRYRVLKLLIQDCAGDNHIDPNWPNICPGHSSLGTRAPGSETDKLSAICAISINRKVAINNDRRNGCHSRSQEHYCIVHQVHNWPQFSNLQFSSSYFPVSNFSVSNFPVSSFLFSSFQFSNLQFSSFHCTMQCTFYHHTLHCIIRCIIIPRSCPVLWYSPAGTSGGVVTGPLSRPPVV